MQVKLPVTVEATITLAPRDLARLIMRHVRDTYVPEDFDDAGCDWQTTRDTRHVVVGGARDWVASTDLDAVVLVDAYNTLMGFDLHLEDEEGAQ